MAKFEKRHTDNPDGASAADMDRCRAIHNDPEAYREWRLRMGLNVPPEKQAPAQMRARVSRLLLALGVKLA